MDSGWNGHETLRERKNYAPFRQNVADHEAASATNDAKCHYATKCAAAINRQYKPRNDESFASRWRGL
jgi:hypothetical protein